MARVVVRPKARRDINGILAHYIDTASLEAARRFRKAATETFAEFAETPLIGTPRKVRNPEFRGLADVARSEVQRIPHFLYASKRGSRH